MRNFNLLGNDTIQLPSGVFAGVESLVCYPSGELEGIRLSKKNMLITHIGELIPAYNETYRRKTKYSVEFYKCGMVKAVALDEMQEIQTPIGEFPAELVTFFETGELKRFFPLDGKISGMWSETEEKSLAIPLSFELPFTAFAAIISGVAFYKNGGIRSITLFPGESALITTKYGEILARNGFSLHESGELESLEPFKRTEVQTTIGLLSAFDPHAVGINADSNSLVFDRVGRIISLTTVHDRVVVQMADRRSVPFGPREIVNPLDNESMITMGQRISFDYGTHTVTFADGKSKATLSIPECEFVISAYSG